VDGTDHLMRVFFFGLGYSSSAAARALHDADPSVEIAGTTRTTEGLELLADTSYRAHLFDGSAPGATLYDDLSAATHVVISIPPTEAGDPVLTRHRDDIIASQSLEWIGYYSTVGVYGDFGGQWIDEDATTRPVNERSRQRVIVEEQWRQLARERSVPLTILRLAGIYGPGRSAFDKLRAGDARRIVKPGQVFNRIHVEDIGRVTALAARRRLDGTFNLADDEPAPPQDLVTHAAGLIGIPPPPEMPFADAKMTPMARSFYADNKRVRNTRIKQALGIDLLYPSFREGLRAILEQQG
jgi:nucleoside-diphosphate-sugar epimerase